MSLDFPNRNTWLALRNLKPKRPRLVHLSADLTPIEKDGKLVGYNVARGVTYRKKAKPPAELPELTYLPKPVQTAVRATLQQAQRDASWLDL